MPSPLLQSDSTAGLRRCPRTRSRTCWCASLAAILREHEPSWYVDSGTEGTVRPAPSRARRRSSLSAAKLHAAERRRREAERAAAERVRRERAEAAARERYL